MGSIIGSSSSSQSQAQQTTAASGVTIQSSCYGKVIPVVIGTNMIAPNLIWYGAFTAVSHVSSSSSSSGKGGGGGSSSSTTSYTYTASLCWALCEGPISDVTGMWVGSNATEQSYQSLGYGLFVGSYPQSPWGYLQSYEPDSAQTYPGVAYLAAANYDLGDSSSLPNNNIAIAGVLVGAGGTSNANPADAVREILTNPHWGLLPAFPSDLLGDLTQFRNYALATGLLVSPVYTDQQSASQAIDDITKFCNAEIAWTGGVLNFIPYGDQPITANGVTYVPPGFTFDLTDDDWLANNAATTSSGSSSSAPLVLTQVRPQSIDNKVTLEYVDASSGYAASTVSAPDQASIQTYGLICTAGSQTAHLFTDAATARKSAQLLLQKGSVPNSWQGTVGEEHICIDLGDRGYISNGIHRLDHLPVEVKEITEQSDGSRLLLMKEYAAGTGTAAAHGYATGNGYAVDYNADPGDVSQVVMFEPPDALASGLALWIGAYGGSLWGGAWVWISLDGDKYTRLGKIDAPARIGTLTAPLAAASAGSDTTNTLAVDLTASRGTLTSGSAADLQSLVTLSYVDGELLAYQNATLTATNHYSLAPLIRGAYDTTVSSHLAGGTFVRLDDAIFSYPFTSDDIGTRIYLKFASFNIWGGDSQDLSEVQEYSYALKGSALMTPLPDVTGLTTTYVAGLIQISWNAVSDFRTVDYEIRQGDSPEDAQVIGRTPLTQAPAYGDGKYWVAAHYTVPHGQDVYSSDWAEIEISGAQLVSNVLAGWDEAATGWTGAFDATAIMDGTIRLAAAGNLLEAANVLAAEDIINYGGIAPTGTYTIPASHRIDAGRITACNVAVTLAVRAQSIDDNLLSAANIFELDDLLSSALGVHVTATAQIRLSQDGATWGDWQNWIPGTYVARTFDFRVVLTSDNNRIMAILTAFTFAVDVPDRVDLFTNLTIPAAGLTVRYADGLQGNPAAAFNGGPMGASSPNVLVTILAAQQGDDVILTNQDCAGFTIKIVNAGAGVERSTNIVSQGF